MNLIDVCNRSCVFCPKADPVLYPNNPIAWMDIGSATRLAKTTAAMDFAGVYSISGWGEPLLHKQLEDIVASLKTWNPHATVEVQTNGDPLSIQRMQTLCNAGVDQLVINLYDGPEQADAFVQMERDADVFDGFITLQHKYHKEASYGMILNNRAGALAVLKEPLNESCYMPFYKIMVDWNLDVYFCDYDWAKRVLLGDLHTTEMVDVWMSPTMKTIRENLFKGNRNLTACQFCNAKGTLYGKKQADIIMQHYKEQT